MFDLRFNNDKKSPKLLIQLCLYENRFDKLRFNLNSMYTYVRIYNCWL